MTNPYFENIEISNYRLCKSCQFKPDQRLNGLIGPNGSGKTTILRGIHLLKQLVSEERYFSQRGFESEEVEPTRIKVSINIDGKKIIHTANLRINTDENNNDEIVDSKQTWYMKDVTGNRRYYKMPVAMANEMAMYYDYIHTDRRRVFLPRHFRTTIEFDVLEQANVMGTIGKVSEFYKQITYYSASQFTNPSNCPVSFEIDEKNKPISRLMLTRGHGKWLYDMFVEYKESTAEFTQFEDIVGLNGIGLVDRFEFHETEMSSMQARVRLGGELQTIAKKTKLIIPKFHIGNNVMSPTQLSEGTFKTLAMVFYLMTGKSKVVLLEEPEVCIHHGLLSSLIELIKQYSDEKQVFISTHSDYILDELDHSNVFVTWNDKSEGISLRPLTKWMPKEDIRALKTFLASEGNLGEYWRSGGFDDTRKD